MKFGTLLFSLVALSVVFGAEPPESAKVAEQIAALRREIARHDELYHRRATPEISDDQYDRLKRRLQELERAFPAAAERAAAAAPLAEVGDDRVGLFSTYRHRERMLSLQKAYTPEELAAFDARLRNLLGREVLDYVVEPKFDGLAVSVTYAQGRLVRAVTRGNGTEGDDITANAKMIGGLPERLSPGAATPAWVEVRGEIYVPFRAFERVNEQREAAGEMPFATPRNLAAGTIRQRDPEATAMRGLQVVFYGFGGCEPLDALPGTQREWHARLAAWGLPTPADTWFARGGKELRNAIAAVKNARRRFDFPTDGVVVKLDTIALQREVGTGESAPRWALAYKFPAERTQTRVRAITIQVGRTGVLTPVAELEPVELAGSRIARATLHNPDEIRRKDIRVGDTVVLEKAGEIVPAIVEVDLARRTADAQPFTFPEHCPACGGAAVQRVGSAALFCPNRGCPAQVRRRVEHFASRACMNITGLGPATIAALVDAGAVKEVSDLYRLRREDLRRLPQIGDKTAERLLQAIDASKRAELWRVVHGLGIPRVGAVTARQVAARCGSLEEFLKMAAGDAATATVQEFLSHEANRAVVSELIAAGVQPVVRGDAGPLAGKIFVFTGRLTRFTRAEARERVEAAGGIVRDELGARTDYVVVGAEPGAKLAEAKRREIVVLEEAELEAMLRE